jgi:SAM-dependent methyltransferase
VAAEARYDKFAERYAAFADTYDDAQPHPPLPADIAGLRVLDLACGTGRFSRHLAARSAHVTGVDLSAQLIEIARGRDDHIEYLVGDASSVDWWDGHPFDGVSCHMALMDIDDLDGAITAVATVLKPGGWFCFSLLHPCNPGKWEGSPDAASSWPPDKDYATEGWWTTGADGVRGNVGSNHRMLATYLNTLLHHGFTFDEFAETAMPGPMYFLGRCTRT